MPGYINKKSLYASKKTYPVERKCACGTVLSIYNPELSCSVCESQIPIAQRARSARGKDWK